MIETTCKGCVFAQRENGKQKGCQLDRLEKLGFRENHDGESFSVERFCNTARPKEWLESLSFEESLDIKKTVMKEVTPRVGFLIYFDSDADDAIKLLEKSVQEAVSQEYEPRYIIVANKKVEYNEAIQKILKELLPEDTEHHIVQMLKKVEKKVEVIDECFRHALNGWLYTTTSGETIPSNLLAAINKIINQEMKRLTVVEPYDEFNGMIFQAALFKFVNGNRPKAWTIEDIDKRPFLDKIKDLDRGNSIMSWEEFHEKLS